MSPLVRIAGFGRPVAPRLALAVVLGAGAAGAAIGLAATSAWLLSRAAQEPPILYLMVAITAVRAFGIARAALRYAERLAAHDAAFRVLGELRGRAYARLERLAPAGLAEFRSGDLLSRLVADVDGLADLWLRVLLPYAVAGIAGLCAALLVGALVPAAGLMLVASLLLVALVGPLLVDRVTRRAERRLAPARGALAAASLDLLAGAPELLVAGTLPARLTNVSALDAVVAAGEKRVAIGAGLGTLIAGLASGAATWLALILGIVALRAGRLDGVALAVVALTPIAAHEGMAGLISAAQHVPGLATSAERLLDVLDRPVPVYEAPSPVPLPAGPYGLRLRGVRARYGDGPEVLHGVDLELRAGERAIVTGPSGSGKSTLGAILLRFLEPSEGTVEIVGATGPVDLARLAGDDVRRIVGASDQDPHIFNASIAQNLRLARPDASADELREVLSTACLLDWVEALPDGLDTAVGEQGARLSSGQRQRLSLARLLLAERSVVIFDEPTEHLDESMATELMRDMLAATAGRTVVVLTHRPDLMGSVEWAASIDLGLAHAAESSWPDGRAGATLASSDASRVPALALRA
ncbi:MAG: thiol reductant ABC exporter subunit CydC [Candidatus Limnocylindrales bacterium]|jgi:thiol reductant ABC exporter CydC subunit